MKWSEMTVSKKLHDESNGVSQHNSPFLFLADPFALSLSFSDHIQHLIFDSREKYTPSRSFSAANECAQMKANTGRWKMRCVSMDTRVCAL